MAAISVDDMDRAIVTFCYVTDDRMTVRGRLRYELLLPWAYVQFPDSTDPRYVAPVTGFNSVGLNAQGGQPYFAGSEYMRNAPFPHEADLGPRYSGASDDSRLAGPVGIHFFGPV